MFENHRDLIDLIWDVWLSYNQFLNFLFQIFSSHSRSDTIVLKKAFVIGFKVTKITLVVVYLKTEERQ